MRTATTALLAILLLVPVACVQKTETQRSSDGTTTVETSTSTTTTPAYQVDTAATAEMKKDANDAANSAAEAGRDAAQATGTALEQAGKKIQKHAKPGDQK